AEVAGYGGSQGTTRFIRSPPFMSSEQHMVPDPALGAQVKPPMSVPLPGSARSPIRQSQLGLDWQSSGMASHSTVSPPGIPSTYQETQISLAASQVFEPHGSGPEGPWWHAPARSRKADAITIEARRMFVLLAGANGKEEASPGSGRVAVP